MHPKIHIIFLILLMTFKSSRAQEINILLETRAGEISQIIDNSKTKIMDAVQESKSQINSGKNLAINCKDTFEQVNKNTSFVNEAINEIQTFSTSQNKELSQLAI